jgi:hypothetical protein
MIPPGKTSLSRMQTAAHNEATRIEISQDGRVNCGMLAQPMPDQIKLRDDFAGIVRLIDLIEADPVIMGRIEDAMRKPVAARAAVTDRKKEETELVPVGEEVEGE